MSPKRENSKPLSESGTTAFTIITITIDKANNKLITIPVTFALLEVTCLSRGVGTLENPCQNPCQTSNYHNGQNQDCCYWEECDRWYCVQSSVHPTFYCGYTSSFKSSPLDCICVMKSYRIFWLIMTSRIRTQLSTKWVLCSSIIYTRFNHTFLLIYVHLTERWLHSLTGSRRKNIRKDKY